MPSSRRFAKVAAVAAAAALIPAAAWAGYDAVKLDSESTLAPSVPTDPVFHGVAPGGAPWVIDRGSEAKVGHGRLDLRVRGLVLPGPPGNGTAGPITSITASLYCGADANATPAATSQSAPLSRAGNGRIRDRSFSVPATCLAPIVVVHPNGNPAAYIAISGARP